MRKGFLILLVVGLLVSLAMHSLGGLVLALAGAACVIMVGVKAPRKLIRRVRRGSHRSAVVLDHNRTPSTSYEDVESVYEPGDEFKYPTTFSLQAGAPEQKD